jgi:hypothetical protein
MASPEVVLGLISWPFMRITIWIIAARDLPQKQKKA